MNLIINWFKIVHIDYFLWGHFFFDELHVFVGRVVILLIKLTNICFLWLKIVEQIRYGWVCWLDYIPFESESKFDTLNHNVQNFIFLNNQSSKENTEIFCYSYVTGNVWRRGGAKASTRWDRGKGGEGVEVPKGQEKNTTVLEESKVRSLEAECREKALNERIKPF